MEISKEILAHKHILVSGDNGNALGVLRSLAQGGAKPILIFIEEDDHLPCLIKSKYVSIVYRVRTDEEIIDILFNTYGNESRKPFIYTCDDCMESVWDEHYDELKDKFYFFNAGEKGRINKLMNKHEICLVAEKCGCRIPKQEIVDTGVLPKTLRYPVITKTLMSIMGAWKGDVYICHDEEELKEAYTKIQSPKLLLQEYIYKKNELALEGFSIDGGREVYIPYGISFFRFSPEGYGSYMYCKIFEDKQLLEQLKSIIRECRFTGCFEIEFLIDQEDMLWFLEVNFRYSFWNYAITFGGLNYPLAWAQSVLDNHITEAEDGELKPYFTAMSEPGDFGQSVASKKISFWNWVMDVHKADMCYFYHPEDPRPAWSFWYHKIQRKLRRKIKGKK